MQITAVDEIGHQARLAGTAGGHEITKGEDLLDAVQNCGIGDGRNPGGLSRGLKGLPAFFEVFDKWFWEVGWQGKLSVGKLVN
jgi:hypothetical protein